MAAFLSPLLLLAILINCAFAIDCNGSLTITSETDAKQIRENCKVIGGDLEFSGDIRGNINLDGLEEVQGTWTHNGLNDSSVADNIESPGLFNISSSTLKIIGGRLNSTGLIRLERLLLPSLENVTGSVSFDSVTNLTHVDLTNLKYFGSLDLEAPELQQFKIDEFKGFTGNNNHWVSISNAGSVGSLDGLFKGPVPPTTEDTVPTISIQNIPKVKQLTLGWKHIKSAQISGQRNNSYYRPYPNITLTLGGADSETVRIDKLVAREGITGIERGSKTSNLSIGNFRSLNDLITDLRLPFHQVSDVVIVGSRITSLEFPEEAEQWNNVSISIQTGRSLRLDSPKNGEGRQIWYWPKENIFSFFFVVDATTDFFKPLIEGKTRIKNDFTVVSSKILDCDIFTKMEDRLPRFYACTPKSSNDSLLIFPSHWSFLAMLCTLFIMAV